MAADSDPLGVGVVGAGHIASTAHLPVLDYLDGAEVTYVADVDGQRVERLSGAYGADAVCTDDPVDLPRADVVLLATPLAARGPYLRTLGDRGTPVFAEKPFAPDLQTHRAYVERVPGATCNYHRQFLAATEHARTLVASGAFGPLREARFVEGGVVGATGRPAGTRSLAGVGMLLDTGCHLLSQLRVALDGWDIRVADSAVEWDGDFDVDVSATLVATRDDRDREVPIALDLSRVRPLDPTIALRFEGATVSFDPTRPDARPRVETGAGTVRLAPGRTAATSFAGAVARHWERFLVAVRAGDPPGDCLGTAPAVTRLVGELAANTGNTPGAIA